MQKMLISSLDPLMRKLMLALHGFTLGDLCSSQFMDLALYRNFLPLFQDNPRYYLVCSLEFILLLWKYILLVPFTLSWYRTQKGSHDIPTAFFDMNITLDTVLEIMS